jgi:2-methylcitrate dehydratase PrpD
MESSSATGELARFAADLKVADLPEDVIHQAERIILDTCGCAIAGYVLDNSKKLADVMQAMGGVDEATILATGLRSTAATAAMINTQLSNALDLDDTLLFSAHLANTSVLPALAIAEKGHAAGGELVAAVVAAYEVSARVMLSLPSLLKSPDSQPDGKLALRAVGSSYNVFGAVVGAGRTMRLAGNQMAHAMGVAGYTTTPMTVANAFSMRHLPDMKYAGYGWMAWSGIVAALLARNGFTANDMVLDGPEGYWRMIGADSCEFDLLASDLGSKWWIRDTAFKAHPAGTWMRYPMLAIDRIVDREDLRGEEVVKIVVRTFLIRGGPFVVDLPHSFHDTQVNYPYLLAMRALRVPPNRWHTQEVYEDPAVLQMMRKIEFVPDESAADGIVEQMKQWHGRTTQCSATVEVYARGSVYRESTDHARGDPHPDYRLSDSDLADKFRLFASDVIPREHVDEAIPRLLGISSTGDVADVIRVLTRGGLRDAIGSSAIPE